MNEEEKKFLIMIVVVCVCSIILFGAVSWLRAWVSLPLRKMSAQNVEAQWQWAYNAEEDLQASARQVCNARNTLSEESDENAKVQWRSHVTAREDNYARIAADYNARMRNAFRAKYIRPDDVRENAPNVDEMIEELGLTCGCE